jgi:hypothetical protein
MWHCLKAFAVILCAVSVLVGRPAAAQGEAALPSGERLPAGLPPVTARTSTAPGIEVIPGIPSEDRRIVGLIIVSPRGARSVCSGLWLSANIVLTAAHCLCSRGAAVKEVYVSNDSSLPSSGEPLRLPRATHVLKHERYSCIRGGAGFDIGLVYLKNSELTKADPKKFDPNQRGITAGEDKDICPEYSLYSDIKTLDVWRGIGLRRVTVSGFGWTRRELGTRNKVQVDINSLDCNSFSALSLGCYPLREMIAGAGPRDRGVRDSCQGDSGGPAYFMVGDRIYPVGVVSRGLPRRAPVVRGQCGAGGIYTLLGRADILDWLWRHNVRPGAGQAC